MSRDSRKNREQLKQEYKEHFRKMRAAKERFKRVQKKKNIVDALREMDSSELMESFDSFLFEVQSKVARAEARLDVALEGLNAESDHPVQQAEAEEMSNRAKAKETLRQVKHEMGLLYSELERDAEAINVNKTVGAKSHEGERSASDKT
ncbi:MAG TPA: hypothetical protein VE868_09820 [Balneolaceae bacterium]|nr:hypothetical protein [Balneolaceae bacterium]